MEKLWEPLNYCEIAVHLRPIFRSRRAENCIAQLRLSRKCSELGEILQKWSSHYWHVSDGCAGGCLAYELCVEWAIFIPHFGQWVNWDIPLQCWPQADKLPPQWSENACGRHHWLNILVLRFVFDRHLHRPAVCQSSNREATALVQDGRVNRAHLLLNLVFSQRFHLRNLRKCIQAQIGLQLQLPTTH
jgi:hypothetical protein